MGPIFINDDGKFIIATVKRLGRFKFFINAAARARHQYRPRMQLIKSIRSSIKVGSRFRAGLQHLGRLLRSNSASTPASNVVDDSSVWADSYVNNLDSKLACCI